MRILRLDVWLQLDEESARPRLESLAPSGRGRDQLTTMIEVQVQRLDTGLPLPARAHPGDAGIDLYASVDVVIGAGERATVPTGIAIAIPEGYAGYVQPRSGLAARHGIGIVNAPGLIDSGYRGEVKVILVNLSAEKFEVRRGDKIAQLVVLAVPEVTLAEVDELPLSARGEKGFGSTGR